MLTCIDVGDFVEVRKTGEVGEVQRIFIVPDRKVMGGALVEVMIIDEREKWEVKLYQADEIALPSTIAEERRRARKKLTQENYKALLEYISGEQRKAA